MKEIIFLTNTDSGFALLKKAKKLLLKEERFSGEGDVFLLSENERWSREWTQRLEDCAAVVIDWMGNDLDTPFLKEALFFLQRKKICFKMNADEVDEEKESYGFDESDHLQVTKYKVYGGIENYTNLWLWMFDRFCQIKCDWQEPVLMLWHGIYHPRATHIYTNVEEYTKDFCQAHRPTIGLLFYRNEWLLDNLAYQKAIIEACERKGLNVIAVFSQGISNPEMGRPCLEEAVRQYFRPQENRVVDVLVNTIKFSLSASGSLDRLVLEELNVPLIQAYTLLQTTEDWENSTEGLSAMEVSISITLPEFDGIIHGIPISGKYRTEEDGITYVPINERIEWLVGKAKKWAVLQKKANCEKKIAIIFHNYPPKNSNIGTALGMDSPESVRLLLAEMQAQGYRIDHIPEDSKSFMEEVIRCATNDRRYMNDEQLKKAIGWVSREDYQGLFATLSETVQQKMIEAWGKPPGEVFAYEGQLLIPGMANGNIIITVQPPRGFGEEPGKIYHDPVTPPTHHYLAFYYWLREIWQADAVIHVGTHGSVEWLPGKGTGLSADCYPDICIGDLPNIYHYVVTVVGEGVQAKRRSAACLVDYLTPPISHAGTYDELEELEQLLDDYCHFQNGQTEKLENIKPLIEQKAAEAHLDDDIKLEDCQDFGEYVGKIHQYVTDIKNMQVRVGLHTLGVAPQGEELREYLLALTRIENGTIPSLAKILAQKDGFDYYKLLEHSDQFIAEKQITCGNLVDQIRQESAAIVTYLMERDFDSAVVAELLQADYADMQAEWKEWFRLVCCYICTDIAPSLAKTVQEMTNTLRALAGQYIEPSAAGAPTSGRADVLPTGRNFYGVDPRLLPTKAAWEVGMKMADGVICDFVAAEGHYPESVGIVLWAGSNMRTHGECIAQFMYLQGIRPIWQRGSGRVIGLEVISLEELQRPRIDVTGRVSGMLRDSMPCTVEWMDQATQMAAALEEPLTMNFIRKHVLTDSAYLEEQGVIKEDAWKQASYRMFGCPPGGYGAGVANLLEEKNWETIDDLAQVYVRWGAHVYGDGQHGAYMPEMFKRRLSTMEVTIHDVDNREINILSSDDFNSYHGGMIAAVRSLRGQAPRSYCSDSTDKNHVVMRSVQDEVKRIFRGEVMNPKFIEGMKKHGYKGAADLANYVAHSYQWDATSSVIEDWMYDKFAEKYALDPNMQEWMKEVNPWALQRIADTLLEASQRGLWQAEEEILEALKSLYLSIEGDLEERSDL